MMSSSNSFRIEFDDKHISFREDETDPNGKIYYLYRNNSPFSVYSIESVEIRTGHRYSKETCTTIWDELSKNWWKTETDAITIKTVDASSWLTDTTTINGISIGNTINSSISVWKDGIIMDSMDIIDEINQLKEEIKRLKEEKNVQ